MQEMKCTKCGQDRQIGRKMCRNCYLEVKREKQKNHYKLYGHYKYQVICMACNQLFSGWRKNQQLCKSCFRDKLQLAQQTISTNKYRYQSNKEDDHLSLWAHRRIAEQKLQRKLGCHEVVHHLDNNPQNNNQTNLIVISRSNHGKLHRYLDLQRVILEKSGNENLGNCWNNLIIPITTTWLEMTNVKVLKIWEIGQSAAESLPSIKDQAKGSETTLQTSDYRNMVKDEDIVQTAT